MAVGARWNSLAAVVTASETNAWYGQFCGGTLIAPGIGTVVGGAVGGLIGGAVGYIAGSSVGSTIAGWFK